MYEKPFFALVKSEPVLIPYIKYLSKYIPKKYIVGRIFFTPPSNIQTVMVFHIVANEKHFDSYPPAPRTPLLQVWEFQPNLSIFREEFSNR